MLLLLLLQVLDLDKEKMGEWPCLLLADAPEEVEVIKPILSGAKGEVDVQGPHSAHRPVCTQHSMPLSAEHCVCATGALDGEE